MTTKVTGVLQPVIQTAGMPGFLLWAKRDVPALYSALKQQFGSVRTFDEQLDDYVDPAGLQKGVGDFSDVLSDIGSTISSAAGDIGNWVATNAGPILAAGASVLVASKQASVVNTQLKLAQASQPPVRTAITYTAQGAPVPVAVQPMTSPTLPGVVTGYAPVGSTGIAGIPWTVIAIGGVGLLALVFLLKRR